MDGELEYRYAELGPTWAFSGRKIKPKRQSLLRLRIRRRLARLIAFNNRKRQNALLQHLISGEFDLIYSNTITNGEVLDWLAPLGIPVVTHVHEMSHWIEACGPENLVSNRKYSSEFFAASHAVKRELVEGFDFPADRISVVHEFIPTINKRPDSASIAALKDQLGIPPDAFVVTGSGIETWRKGKDLFVDLAAELSQRQHDQDICFLWVGGWEHSDHRNKIQQRLRKLGLEDRVLFIGQVNNPLDYFAASDVFAITSREDPYPLVCLEAASLEIPVICFADAGGMPEFVEEDAGLVVPYLDTIAMADGIAAWACDRELVKKIGKTAAKKVRQRNDVDRGSRTIHKLIEDLLERNSTLDSAG